MMAVSDRAFREGLSKEVALTNRGSKQDLTAEHPKRRSSVCSGPEIAGLMETSRISRGWGGDDFCLG